jgi:hypothetical protein
VTVRLRAVQPGNGAALAIRDADGSPLPDAAQRLERCFASVRADWEAEARTLPASAVNDRGHFGTSAPNVSDHGLMLAWSGLVRELAAETETYEADCADPWLYRHLQTLDGVSGPSAPGLTLPRLKLALRGFAARARTALAMARAARSLRGQKAESGGAWLHVYGHPASDAAGRDGYFGDLMQRIPSIRRLLHVDCPPARARELMADGRTVSLHGFGSALHALTLPFRTWRLPASALQANNHWLVRRALDQDRGYAGAAMIAWQIHCQRQWLAQIRPETVFWPWENHGWERSFCRDLRRAGGRSVGYQHSVVGQQWNLGPGSNPDGAESLPDTIICNGPSGYRQLLGAGHPESRLVIGGAHRFPAAKPITHDPDAPVFVAVPFDLEVARQMVEACRAVPGRRFVIRVHPMTPLQYETGGNIESASAPLGEQQAVSAVLYAATTVGLEGWMAGLPVIRFLPSGRIAIDIMPDDLDVPAAGADDLAAALDKATAAAPASGRDGEIFAPVDIALWERYANAAPETNEPQPTEEMTA